MQPPKRFKPYPFAYHEELKLEIVSLSNLGVGIAKVQLETLTEEAKKNESLEPSPSSSSTSGWVIFVPHTLPGEKVIARIFRNDKNHSQADLIEVLTPSPDRIEPNRFSGRGRSSRREIHGAGR